MPHKKSTSNSIQNVKYTSINKENKKNINEPSGKIVNEPHQAKLDELPQTARLSKKSKDFSDNKQTKSYIITKKIVYASCAIGCTWHMIYK
jgi:hypothetical protein